MYHQTKNSKIRIKQNPGTTISLQQQSMYQFCALYQVKEDGGIAGINCKDVQHYYIVHTLKRPRKDETKRCSRTKKKCSSCGLASHHEMMMTDPGRPRGLPLPPPPILVDQLTLFRPGEQILPTTLLLPPSDFQTLLRPWSWNDDDGGDLRVKSRYCTRI